MVSCFGWWFAKLSQYILLGRMWSLLRMNNLVTSILDHNRRNLHCLRHNGLYSSKIKHACKCMVMVDTTDLSHGRRTASTACSHVHESALSLAKVVAALNVLRAHQTQLLFIYLVQLIYWCGPNKWRAEIVRGENGFAVVCKKTEGSSRFSSHNHFIKDCVCYCMENQNCQIPRGWMVIWTCMYSNFGFAMIGQLQHKPPPHFLVKLTITDENAKKEYQEPLAIEVSHI